MNSHEFRRKIYTKVNINIEMANKQYSCTASADTQMQTVKDVRRCLSKKDMIQLFRNLHVQPIIIITKTHCSEAKIV